MYKRLIFRKLSVQILILVLAVLFSCTHEAEEKPQSNNPCSANFLFGYTDKVSYSPGDLVKVFMQSKLEVDVCRIDIYTLDGDVAFSSEASMAVQVLADNPSMNGFGFTQFSEISVPTNLPSGIYLIEKSIPFVIKTATAVDLLVVYPSNTANAYELSGGKSLYTAPASERPSAVSFLRPIALQSLSEHCLKWFNTLTHLKIGYIADIDLDDYQNLNNAQVLVLPGHNEYWTREARTNFDQFVNSGKHAIVLSGNTMWWQVRYSSDKTSLICYKDPNLDPEGNSLLKTITWDNATLQYSIISSLGADFNRGGYGLKSDNGWDGYKFVNSNSPLLEGLTLTNGSKISLPSLEYDGAPIKSFDANGFPVIDNDILKFNKIELVGFDKGFRGTETVGTFIVFQRTPTSGVIVNTASTNWCSSEGIGGHDEEKIKKITLNAINKLVNHQMVFTN